MEVVIFVPPEPPTAILMFLSLSNTRVGHMEDKGLFPIKKLGVRKLCICYVHRGGLGVAMLHFACA